MFVVVCTLSLNLEKTHQGRAHGSVKEPLTLAPSKKWDFDQTRGFKTLTCCASAYFYIKFRFTVNLNRIGLAVFAPIFGSYDDINSKYTETGFH